MAIKKYKEQEDINKKLLDMIKRPESISAAEVTGEKDDSGKYSVENPDKPYSVPAQIKEGIKTKFDKPEVQHEVDDSGTFKLEEPKELYHEDPEITEQLRELIKKNKSKYLGR